MAVSILSTLIKGLSEASKSELADTTDLIIEGDVTKRTRLATLAEWIRGKLGIGTASSLTTTSKEVVGAINELNTNMRYIKNLSDLGLNSKANWDAVVSALPDASVITIAAFRSDYPNLTNPGTGNRRVITVMRPYFGYVTIQDWDVDNNTIYYRTHTGNNYTAWKNIG